MGNVRLTVAGVAVSGSLVAATVCVILLIGPIIAFHAWPTRGIGAGSGRPLIISDVTPSGRALLGIGRFALVRAPAGPPSAAPVTPSGPVSPSAQSRVPAPHAGRRHARSRATTPASTVAARHASAPRPSGSGSSAPRSGNTSPAGGATAASPSPRGEGSGGGSAGGASPSASTGRSSTAASHRTATKAKGGKAKGNGNATSSSTSTAAAQVDTAGGTKGGSGESTSSPLASSEQGKDKKIPPGQAKKAEGKGDGGS